MSLLLTALTMMLGWGLRGFIGGGSLGAMIPGAMVALVLCLTRGVTPSARACAFGAIAIGFGGEMTYGQTVGAAAAEETRAWGLLGLTVKGAVWGLLGGAVLRLGFLPVSPQRMAQIAALVTGACWLGWKLVNQPKLIYFSNRLDRPREEVWAGLLLAGLTLLAWPGDSLLRRFALWGALGGGLGFGLGGTINALGIEHWGPKHSWWKAMEFTFGWCFGWGLGLAARHLPASSDAEPAPAGPAPQIGVAVFATLWLMGDLYHAPVRFEFLVYGLLTLCLVTLWPWAAWQVGLTVTITATIVDLADLRKGQHGTEHYTLAVGAAVLLSVFVARFVRDARSALLLVTWATVTVATARFFLAKGPSEPTVAVSFLLMAVTLTALIRRGVSLPRPNAP